MEGRCEDNSCVRERGDDDEQRIAETISQHHVRGTETVSVRELRSQGLSFQLWPVANAMCLYLEKEFGEGKMSLIDAHPPHLERDIARWCSSSAVVLGRNLPFGDTLHEGLENLVVDSSIHAVNDNGMDLGNNFVREGIQHPNSNLQPVAKVFEGIGKPIANRNICNQRNPLHLQGIERPFAHLNNGHQLDQVVGTFESNLGHSMNCIETNGTHTVDKSVGNTEAGGNIHYSKRRMRVLELGSGTGMVGIVAACLGADVVLTDLPHVIDNLSHNLDLNKTIIAAAGGSVEAKVLRWGVEEDVQALGGRFFDLILASDCVYYDTSYKPLLQTLTWLMRSSDKDITDLSPVQQLQQRKPTGLNRVRGNALPSQIPELPLSLLSVSKSKILPPIDHDDKVSGKIYGEQSASQIDTPASRKEQEVNKTIGGNECVILLGHLRRWKKDSKFFRMASKLFDVSIIHRHPPQENERIGPLIYRLSTKLDRKTDRSRSSIGSLSSC